MPEPGIEPRTSSLNRSILVMRSTIEPLGHMELSTLLEDMFHHWVVHLTTLTDVCWAPPFTNASTTYLKMTGISGKASPWYTDNSVTGTNNRKSSWWGGYCALVVDRGRERGSEIDGFTWVDDLVYILSCPWPQDRPARLRTLYDIYRRYGLSS